MSVTDTLAPVPVGPVPKPPGPPAPPAKSPRRLAGELLGVLAVVIALAATTGHLDLLVVILSIIVIVMVHELGHFLAAKHGGMKVTEYFVGFGPRLWSFRRGETEYGVKALPLGGYVKIPGMTNLEEVDPADEGRLYRDKPFQGPPAGGRGRLGHALPDGLRPLVGPVHLHRGAQRQSGSDPGDQQRRRTTGPGGRWPGCVRATSWWRWTARRWRET